MSTRIQVSSGSPYEDQIGFCRAVRIGNHIAVSGTAPVPPEDQPLPASPYDQTILCLQTIDFALQNTGATLYDVIRTRVYLTDITDWPEVARAHSDFFNSTRPASTFVQVTRFIDPNWRVEVEADAVLP